MSLSSPSSSDRPPLALIAGPTASGKSALAVALAQALGRAQVVNADASQVYRDLAVLSARPTADEMAGVRHCLFGHVDGAEAYNAARWAQEARRALAHAWEDGDVPILVGGTGMYLRTLLFGIAPVPDIDPDVRAKVRALRLDDAYAALRNEDPVAAQKLDPTDGLRIARALEVIRSTGQPIAAWQRSLVGGIADTITLVPLVLLPPRDWLRERCDRRLTQMFDGGAIEEVEALVARRLDPDLPVMRAIGVPQIAAFLAGNLSRDEALARAQAATRQYAKRQFTWFRHQPPPEWDRHKKSLNNDSINKIAIKLRDRLLTG